MHTHSEYYYCTRPLAQSTHHKLYTAMIYTLTFLEGNSIIAMLIGKGIMIMH